MALSELSADIALLAVPWLRAGILDQEEQSGSVRLVCDDREAGVPIHNAVLLSRTIDESKISSIASHPVKEV